MPRPSVASPMSALHGEPEEDLDTKGCPSLPDQPMAGHCNGAGVHHVVSRFSGVGPICGLAPDGLVRLIAELDAIDYSPKMKIVCQFVQREPSGYAVHLGFALKAFPDSLLAAYQVRYPLMEIWGDGGYILSINPSVLPK